jgi:fatty-acyl-CoA synthase
MFMTTFSDILHSHYASHPDQLALVLQHAGQPDRPMTYRELLTGANAYAQAYAARGLGADEVVILILQHSADLVFAFYGAILHGAIPAIMPYLTEKLLPERYRADLASLVGVTRPSAIVTYPEFEPEVQAALRVPLAPGVPTEAGGTTLQEGTSVRAVLVTGQIGDPTEPDFAALGGLQRSADSIVLLQHSSGTTGLQKGVALSHRAVLNQVETYKQALHFNPQDVIVSWLPLYHDMGLIAGFLMPVLTGNPLVLMSPFDWVRAPGRLFQAISRYHGTLTWLPNFAYNFCAQKVRARDLEGVDLSNLRGVINCSEPMRYESQQAFLERFAPLGFRASALLTCYAMAENTFAVTQGGVDYPLVIDEIDREAMQVERLARPAQDGRPTIKMVSAGKPVANTQVKVVDEKGNSLPDRQVGELALRSDCMLSEYYHRPDATEKAFLDGWYLTGDFGYMLDGEVFVAGRKKDLIIVGGKNVYPQDIELLAMQVSGVHAGRVSAFGVFNDAAGTEDVIVVAEVDTEDPAEHTRISDEIRQAVNRGSAIVVRHVHVVNPPWIVKTSSGKTARLANREKYLKETEKVE